MTFTPATEVDLRIDQNAALYLELMKKVLTGEILQEDSYIKVTPARKWLRSLTSPVQGVLGRYNLAVMHRTPYSATVRANGRDWPSNAHTMAGLKRLGNVQNALITVVNEKVPGDFIETGVWRGGLSIFARSVLQALAVTDRKVWVADSFAGLPKPNAEKYPEDKNDGHWAIDVLAVSLAQVKENFALYGLLDDQVEFLQGWFKDTLPKAAIQHIAVMRLDGDMYESTMDGLVNLYPKLSKGGFAIIDDYGTAPACAKAVEDYRSANNITDDLIDIDGAEYYWRKS